MRAQSVSIIVPCYNEENAIRDTLLEVAGCVRGKLTFEILAIDDGSTDETPTALRAAAGALSELHVVTHARNQGYGASLKTGIRHARYDWIAITDADGTYPNEKIPELLALTERADMVVGARNGDDVSYSRLRRIPKAFLRWFAQWLCDQPIPDINSGLRVFRRDVAERFFNILPDGFSFTTTITVAMLTNRMPVIYEPIDYHVRVGKSKIRPIRDTLNFVQLILRTGIYFAPLRIFLPVTGFLFVLFMVSLGCDLFLFYDLTDTTVLLLMFSLNTALFALLADMIDKRSG